MADDVLAFAGITPPTLRLYPIETHIAEKLHAYTMPRARPNTRVKDLVRLGRGESTRSGEQLEQYRAHDYIHAVKEVVMLASEVLRGEWDRRLCDLCALRASAPMSGGPSYGA